MPTLFEVFDNEQVQFLTRRQAALLTGLIIGMIAVTAAAMAGVHIGLAPLVPAALFIFAAWLSLLGYVRKRIQELRRVVWCVKLSERSIVGYDYARRKTTFDWIHVRRVELKRDGLTVIGPEEKILEVPHLFTDFPTLSHRIAEHAEFYSIPLFIDGEPLQNVDVYSVFPFLPTHSKESH